jgi:hypothetical protein
MRSRRSLWAFAAAVVLSGWFLPGVVVRVAYGNFPIGNPEKYGIRAGMTRQEVLAVLGPPPPATGIRARSSGATAAMPSTSRPT